MQKPMLPHSSESVLTAREDTHGPVDHLLPDPAVELGGTGSAPSSSPSPARHASRSAPTRHTHSSPRSRSRTVFQLHAPDATSVQLAADFTDWERSPMDLRRGKNGLWRLQLTLAPGRYEYRFLVDHRWTDDPHCLRTEPNPFGSCNAVIEIGVSDDLLT